VSTGARARVLSWARRTECVRQESFSLRALGASLGHPSAAGLASIWTRRSRVGPQFVADFLEGDIIIINIMAVSEVNGVAIDIYEEREEEDSKENSVGGDNDESLSNVARLAAAAAAVAAAAAAQDCKTKRTRKNSNGEAVEEAEVEVDETLYPIFLPIDRNYETKYMYHYRYMAKKAKKSMQERTYVFLEHPAGWGCFFYHMSV